MERTRAPILFASTRLRVLRVGVGEPRRRRALAGSGRWHRAALFGESLAVGPGLTRESAIHRTEAGELMATNAIELSSFSYWRCKAQRLTR